MEKDLRMEAFASTESVKKTAFHVYELHSQKIDNSFSIIRGALWKIKNYNKTGVFEDGKRIYSVEQLDCNIPNADFTLEYCGTVEPEVLENRGLYQDWIKYCVTKRLSEVRVKDQYRKYSCKSDITSKWILTERGFTTFSSKDKDISLERKYGFWVDILDDGKAYMRLDTSTVFSSNRTVYDYLQTGQMVIGMYVKNDWSQNKQTGNLTAVCDYTVTDKVDFADSLKAYYINKKEGKRVENLPDDTPVVLMELQEGKPYPYYPQALKPVLTRERVEMIDPAFSRMIEPYIKRNMETRLTLDKDFIEDIGVLEDCDGLSFSTEPAASEAMGYKKGTVKLPELVCGRDARISCGQEYRVFGTGFYKKPVKKLKIGYLYPKNEKDCVTAVVNAIYSYAVLGKFHGERDKYTIEGMLDIQSAPVIREEYELGDITDYKRAANKLKKENNMDIIIAIVPDGADDDGPYNPFKRIWANANIPSQMISMKTAHLFASEPSEKNTTKYYLQNIVLGILGKTGGIPWIVKDMPGEVDCFVGLDVATMSKGIHYPACSVVFDKYGKLLGFYKPSTPQQGEKITTKILQDIFDQVILSYEEKFGESPKSVMIHRDGFSNENDDWYQHYFAAKGIEYSIVEVRKNISSKLILFEDGVAKNPTMGYCIYSKDKGYLVTTTIEKRLGSPNPLIIEKKCGNLSMPTILTQVMYLSQLHVGSTHKLRLPITTGYADKICKNREYVPEGQMDDRLFFL